MIIIKKFDNNNNDLKEEKYNKIQNNVFIKSNNNNFIDSLNIKNKENDNNIIIYDSKEIEKEKNYENKFYICCIKGNNFSDYELNELEYEKAVIYDKRSFIHYYWQLIRREHLIIFTFFVKDDFNIISIKLSLFTFLIVLDFGINVIFFVDDSMNKIYLDYGKYNFFAQIPQIIYSTLITEIIDIFLRYLCLTEKDIYQIKKYAKEKNKDFNKNQILKIYNCIKIKIICYFISSSILMIFFWYFVTTFCAVYKNTQIILIKDFFLSFLLSLLYPFGLYLFPSSLRILSLKDKKMRLNFLYKLSDIIPFV